jgi:hypothetical protein
MNIVTRRDGTVRPNPPDGQLGRDKCSGPSIGTRGQEGSTIRVSRSICRGEYTNRSAPALSIRLICTTKGAATLEFRPQ